MIVRTATQQLQELQEKYSECIEMLHEAQEELKNLRNRNYPAGTPRRYHPLGLYPMVRGIVFRLADDRRISRLKSLRLSGFSGGGDRRNDEEGVESGRS